MPQQILCIITPQEINLHKSIVHFKINELSFIPVDFSLIDRFIKDSQNFRFLKDYFEHIKLQDNFKEAVFDEDDEPEAHLMKLIEDYRIDHFIIEDYYEWEYTPFESLREKGYLRSFEYSFMYVKSGEIISADSSLFDDENPQIRYADTQKYRKELGLDFDWLSQEKFYSYDCSKKEYLK
ncbi:hypothetical protein SAMN05421594_2512 [Chryseobacterium oleae]|uniref:Uncharacterized protein n=1 Tax=Chryseobacterium oleae TaxID=491207 RepID=A0A1I4YN57_CHROL|nr:hypothetical protein [Chryseobacterium oleae]SFN39040.1 hypothetical protein SAMN05421594_2512 [Chryseobacterium oleae]